MDLLICCLIYMHRLNKGKFQASTNYLTRLHIAQFDQGHGGRHASLHSIRRSAEQPLQSAPVVHCHNHTGDSRVKCRLANSFTIYKASSKYFFLKTKKKQHFIIDTQNQ
jgi:hypothetical protein